MVYCMEHLIRESIEVIAYFHNLEVNIIKFKWNNSVYNVSSINSSWKIPLGKLYELHFSVTCKKQNIICELSYNMNDLKWNLIQYDNL